MKTAVEWYSQKHLGLLVKLENKEISLGEYVTKHGLLLEQAKEMEKEQIMNAFDECGMWQDNYSDSEHYYNKTFKSE